MTYFEAEQGEAQEQAPYQAVVIATTAAAMREGANGPYLEIEESIEDKVFRYRRFTSKGGSTEKLYMALRALLDTAPYGACILARVNFKPAPNGGYHRNLGAVDDVRPAGTYKPLHKEISIEQFKADGQNIGLYELIEGTAADVPPTPPASVANGLPETVTFMLSLCNDATQLAEFVRTQDVDGTLDAAVEKARVLGLEMYYTPEGTAQFRPVST